ncbi:DUF4145 domain-containing protein [Kushneria marisflavi]|uniref:DUF4145 domain-containing protein n=1 Tax=Kushneria marisflavi TaxID=157779 RepID=A0A240UP84_9GAMM|nr:DUF4145 domain-containing protein [Kushneria marisflavi]ART62852.1 hypothetical protein B9H00_07140 [Kushneria marisflavi]RKD84935.1 uncharacterized protein DUF4145 [Kushneria marisflavi]
MSLLVADCPRCGAKEITFDLENQVQVSKRFDWQICLEVFCVCRACAKPTIFLVSQKNHDGSDFINNGLQDAGFAVNEIVKVERFVGIQDNNAEVPPEYLPENIDNIFQEGAACMAIGCYNAAATMFRLCLDLATKTLVPELGEGLNNRIKRNLGLRLPWLIDNGILPEALRDLSTCIKDNGNDGAHEGILLQEDAADILDFTFILLERLYTEPKRLELAALRRADRRKIEK